MSAGNDEQKSMDVHFVIPWPKVDVRDRIEVTLLEKTKDGHTLCPARAPEETPWYSLGINGSGNIMKHHL